MFPEPRSVAVNGVELAVYEQGSGPAVILLHGFPELAFSWRHQFQALSAAGYRVIAPDQRGYGRSTVPPNVTDYAMSELVGDAVGLLDALQIEKATFVGHDWGAMLVWSLAMLRPDRVTRLVALNIPHVPRASKDPITIFRERLGDDFYIVNFQDSDEADRAFASNPRHFFDMLMRKQQISRAEFSKLPAARQSLSLLQMFARQDSSGQPLLSDAERDVFVDAFKRTGFTGPINWYRNFSRNWRALDGVREIIDIPTLFIGASDDVVISLQQIEAMPPLVTDLELHMIDDCGHWTQQEKPGKVNRLLLDWLGRTR